MIADLTSAHIAMAILSLMVGVAGAWFVAIAGARSGLLDRPGRRSSHSIPTPKGGGIGILGAFLIGAIGLGLPVAFGLLAGCVSLAALVGDRMEIAPVKRLVIQFLCAFGILLFAYFHPLANTAPIHWLAIFAGAVFMVGTANFYNFMDGINGIAGINAVVSYSLCGYYLHSVGYGRPFVWLSIFIICAVLGFLPFNIPVARVFMGDVGSILIGFLYGGIVVLTSRSAVDFICLASFLFLFYADELTTMVVRLYSGENLLKAHRRHLYQILANELKQSHWIVSTGYGVLQLMIGVTVLRVAPHGLYALLALLFFFVLVFTGVTVWFRRLAGEISL
jgi:Fuc2NAc and GlcNAc transferase